MNRKRDGFIGIALIVITVLVLGFIIWSLGNDQDREHCRREYGNDYTLWYSRANSSVVACESPEGVLNELR
jgi:hypothetical protein